MLWSGLVSRVSASQRVDLIALPLNRLSKWPRLNGMSNPMTLMAQLPEQKESAIYKLEANSSKIIITRQQSELAGGNRLAICN